MSEWNLLPHEEATLLSIARDEALLSQEDHDYLPKAPEQADVFHPHEWVLEAIRRAYSMGRHAGAERARKELSSVRKAWARFSHELHRGPDAPYPGMADAFEQHFSQSFTDREWRAEAATWAAAWKAAKRHGAQPALSVPDGWKEAAIAWEVCASIHREYGKGKDPFFNTRQGDFVKHANDARAMLAGAPEAKP